MPASSITEESSNRRLFSLSIRTKKRPILNACISPASRRQRRISLNLYGLTTFRAIAVGIKLVSVLFTLSLSASRKAYLKGSAAWIDMHIRLRGRINFILGAASKPFGAVPAWIPDSVSPKDRGAADHTRPR